MQASSLFKRSLVALSCGAALLLAAPSFADDAPPKETARIEVGTPLQAAQKLIGDKKFKDALAKIKEAEAVANRTAYENFLIESMRASAATGAGDDDAALASYESLINSGRLPAAAQQKIIQAVAGTYFKRKDYAKAESYANRYYKEGGTDPAVKDVIYMSLYNAGDFKGTSAQIHEQIDADTKAEHAPKEVHLQLALNSDQKVGNGAGATEDLELLLQHYPKKQYWDLAINHLQHKSGFSERLELDLLRLENALGDLHRDAEYMDFAQLSIEAGFPVEARKVMEQGFSSGVLGKGAEADRQKRLRDKSAKDADEDAKNLSGDLEAEKARGADAAVNTGMNYVLNGKAEHGLALMEAGIAKGGLKRPEDSKLHLGVAYFWAGNYAKAAQVLKTVQGRDGTADLAHLWALLAASKH